MYMYDMHLYMYLYLYMYVYTIMYTIQISELKLHVRLTFVVVHCSYRYVKLTTQVVHETWGNSLSSNPEYSVSVYCIICVPCKLVGVICGQMAMKAEVKRKLKVSNRDREKTPVSVPRVKLKRTGSTFSLKSTYMYMYTCIGSLFALHLCVYC